MILPRHVRSATPKIDRCPASRRAEAGDHFVENQQDSAPLRQRPQSGKEALGGRDDAHVAGNWLDDDRGYGPGVGVHSASTAARSL